MSVAIEFPSVATLQMQSFVGGLLGRPVRDSEVTAFTKRARNVQPRLTERAALVIFALSVSAASITANHFPLKPGVLWVVLNSLHDLGLVEITGERWRAEVMLAEEGRTLIKQVASHD